MCWVRVSSTMQTSVKVGDPAMRDHAGTCRVAVPARALLVFVAALWAGSAHAELSIRSTYPTFQQIGSDVAVTVSGAGFTPDTRLALSLDASNERFILDHIGVSAGPQRYETVVIDGDKAYVAATTGLTIVSIANFSNLRILSTTALPATPSGIEIHGDLAYLAFGEMPRGLAIYDVSDPRQPVEVGRLELAPTAIDGFGLRGFTVHGNVAYVADHTVHGLMFIDVANPSNPQLIGGMGLPDPACQPGSRCTPFHPLAVTVIEGDTTALGGTRSVQRVAWVYGWEQQIMLVDVTDLTDPVFLGMLDPASLGPSTSTFVNAIEVQGQFAFLSGIGEFSTPRRGDLTILDVSDPVFPTYVGHLPLEVQTQGLAVEANRVYLAGGGRGVATVDVTNLQNPALLGWATANDLLLDVAVHQKIVVLSGRSGLTSVNLREPDPPFEAGWGIPDHDGGRHFAIVGNTLYEPADSGQAFNVLDVSDPVSPVVLAAADINLGRPTSITVDGGFAYVTSDSHANLVILDVSDDTTPVEVGRIDASGSGGPGTYAVLIDGDRAYVAARDTGLAIINLSPDRTSPQLERVIANPAITAFESSLAKLGDFIFHGNGAGDGRNYIYDLRDDSVHVWLASHEQIHGIAIRDGLAFTAMNSRGLVVYDLQDPLVPVEIAEVSVPGSFGSVYDIVLEGDAAYLGGGFDNSIHMIDISDPLAPVFVAAVDVPGAVTNVELAGGFGWTGHFNSEPDNARIPLPIQITDTLSENPARLIALIKSPPSEGNYTLTATKGGEVAELPGAITFRQRSLRSGSDGDDLIDAAGLSKVIVVAGGGPFPGNNLWNATVLVARKAYAALTTQGYRRENIRFLSPESLDVDFDGRLNDVDGLASLEGLEQSIVEWVIDPAAPAHELVLYIADHGGDQLFRLNSEQTLSAQQLDAWLDRLQQTLPGRVIVIYEACQSGTFLSELTPPPGKERVVITSAANQPAWFTQQGRLSFSYQFWSVIERGGRLTEAFAAARMMMDGFQTPLFDTNGDGVPGSGDTLKRLRIGRGFIAATDNPTIGAVSAPFETHLHSAALNASGIIDATGVDRVWAVIRPPGYVSGDPDVPVLDIPTLDLQDADGDNTWTGTYNGFREAGDYDVAFFASNVAGGISTPTELNTNRTTVTRIGSDPNLPPDITLVGRAALALLPGETYIEDGVFATDLEDGPVLESLTIISTPILDTSEPGRYEITYTVTDSANLSASVTRSVLVAGDNSVGGPPDFDGDGIADAEDPDDDNDNVPDELDHFPFNASERDDTDGDGIGDLADLDDDGDGINDARDHFPVDASLFLRGSVRNISTRGVVGEGDEVMIAGLIIEGQVARTVVIRARGPSLAGFGIADALANPSLQLFAEQTLLAENADWPLHDSVGNLPVHLTPTDSRESAITVTLEPGAYTAIVRGEGGATGIGIVEVFDVTVD